MGHCGEVSVLRGAEHGLGEGSERRGGAGAEVRPDLRAS